MPLAVADHTLIGVGVGESGETIEQMVGATATDENARIVLRGIERLRTPVNASNIAQPDRGQYSRPIPAGAQRGLWLPCGQANEGHCGNHQPARADGADTASAPIEDSTRPPAHQAANDDVIEA
ncbi:MAG: hypothetical protein R3C44_00745 [Chloroflexota bacterium]